MRSVVHKEFLMLVDKTKLLIAIGVLLFGSVIAMTRADFARVRTTANPEEDVTHVQLSAELTLAENNKRIQAAIEASPDKDLVILPSDDPEAQARMRAELEAYADKKLAEAKADEERKLRSGEYYIGEPPPCARAEGSSIALPTYCGGKIIHPLQDHSAQEERASLSAKHVSERIETELNTLLLGVDEDAKSLGLNSMFSGSAQIRSVSWLDDESLLVDFDAGLSDEVEGASAGRSSRIHEQLLTTIFRYPQVQSVEFSIEGDCDAFWNPMEGECQAAVRSDVTMPDERSKLEWR